MRKAGKGMGNQSSSHLLHGHASEHARRRGHVEDAMSFGSPFLFQLCALFTQSRISLQLLEIALLVMDVRCEEIPDGGLGFSETGKLVDAVVQSSPQRVIAELDAVHRDDRELCRQTSILREVEQGRHEFPPSQVTGSAKNDEHSRFKLVIFGGAGDLTWRKLD